MLHHGHRGSGRNNHPHMRGRERLRAHLLEAIGHGGRFGRFDDDGGGFDDRGGFGRGGRGGGPFGGRKFRADELQLVILALLAEAPAHGYELIRRLETRSNGYYSPSPGVIYPALTFLEETGLTEPVPEEGARKPHRLTEAGREALGKRRVEADSMLAALDRIGERMQGVREAWGERPDAQTTDEVMRARATLRRALGSKHGADAAELRRIAAILERAAAAILGTGEA